MPTASGWSLLAAAAALAPVAALTGYPQLGALAGACVAVLVLARATAPAPRVALRPDGGSLRTVAEEPAHVSLHAHHAAGRRGAPTQLVAVLCGPDDTTATMRGSVPALAVGASRSVGLDVPKLPRGLYRLQSLTAECTDVLGLFRRRRDVPCALTVTVHPRIVDLRPRRRTMDGDDLGRVHGPRLPGDVFHALRDYQPGDDARLIHWMATARTGTPVVRDLVRVDAARQVVVLDTVATPGPATWFDTAVQVAGSLVLASAATDETWLLTTHGLRHRCAPAGSRDAVLDRLAAVRPGAGACPRIPASATAVTVVTGPDVDERRWRTLAGRRDLEIVTVADGPTRRLGRGGPRVLAVPTLDKLAARLQSAGRR